MSGEGDEPAGTASTAGEGEVVFDEKTEPERPARAIPDLGAGDPAATIPDAKPRDIRSPTRPGFFLTAPPDEPELPPPDVVDSTFQASSLDALVGEPIDPELLSAARAGDSADDQASSGAREEATRVGQRSPQVGVAATPRGQMMTQAYDGTPMLEVEVEHRHGPAPRMDRRAPIVEIWTQRHIYTVDAAMVCTGVSEMDGGAPIAGHPFVGQRLVGGQHRDGETFQLTYPFPRPGTEAVFEKGDAKQASFSHTSTVTRVKLRLHVVTVAQTVVTPTWHNISKRELMGNVPLPIDVDTTPRES